MMNSGEIARLRRQMQRRIHAVVAERRIARQVPSIRDDDSDQTPDAAESPVSQGGRL